MKWFVFLIIELFFCWFGFYHLGVSFKKLLAAWSAVFALAFPFFILAYALVDSSFKDLKKKKEDEFKEEVANIDNKYQSINSDLRAELAEKEALLEALIDDIDVQKNDIEGLEKALQTKNKICDRFFKKVDKLSR